MKILFITDNFPPEVNAPATRTYEHCIEWIKHGADVTVITCAPNFPLGKVYEGYKNKLYLEEEMEGIKVVRVWSFIMANHGTMLRTLDYMSFGMTAFFVGLFKDFDIIVATSPQFFTTWAGSALSKIKRKPWIFELRDLWPDSIKTVGLLKEGKITNILHHIEMNLYRDADKIIPVTNAFKTNLIERGIEEDKIEVVTNGANLDLYSNKEKDYALLKKLGLENKFIIGYIGTHGLAHSLKFIVNAIGKIEDPEIHFLFVGNGSVKQDIQALAVKLDLDNITFCNAIPKEQVPNYLSIIDVSLAPLKKSPVFTTVIPSKIFEASAMQKPTLLGVHGQAQEIIEHYNAGIVFEPENEEDFLQKVNLIKENKKLYQELQGGCESLAKAYDRKKLALKMLHIIQDTVQDK